jgi:hypothetical protein
MKKQLLSLPVNFVLHTFRLIRFGDQLGTNLPCKTHPQAIYEDFSALFGEKGILMLKIGIKAFGRHSFFEMSKSQQYKPHSGQK